MLLKAVLNGESSISCRGYSQSTELVDSKFPKLRQHLTLHLYSDYLEQNSSMTISLKTEIEKGSDSALEAW